MTACAAITVKMCRHFRKMMKTFYLNLFVEILYVCKMESFFFVPLKEGYNERIDGGGNRRRRFDEGCVGYGWDAISKMPVYDITASRQ